MRFKEKERQILEQNKKQVDNIKDSHRLELTQFNEDFNKAKSDMQELTKQISTQDVQIEELKDSLQDRDNRIAEREQEIEGNKVEFQKMQEKVSRMDDENFKSKMA